MVTIANGDISIEYLSYKFNSKHCFVFNDSKPKIRVKFETTSLDDENLFFDIFLNRNGIIDTEYSKELNGHSLDLMKHENIESNLAKMIFGFFEKNKLLGEQSHIGQVYLKLCPISTLIPFIATINQLILKSQVIFSYCIQGLNSLTYPFYCYFYFLEIAFLSEPVLIVFEQNLKGAEHCIRLLLRVLHL